MSRGLRDRSVKEVGVGALMQRLGFTDHLCVPVIADIRSAILLFQQIRPESTISTAKINQRKIGGVFHRLKEFAEKLEPFSLGLSIFPVNACRCTAIFTDLSSVLSISLMQGQMLADGCVHKYFSTEGNVPHLDEEYHSRFNLHLMTKSIIKKVNHSQNWRY